MQESAGERITEVVLMRAQRGNQQRVVKRRVSVTLTAVEAGILRQYMDTTMSLTENTHDNIGLVEVCQKILKMVERV